MVLREGTPYFRERLIEHLIIEEFLGRVEVEEWDAGDAPAKFSVVLRIPAQRIFVKPPVSGQTVSLWLDVHTGWGDTKLAALESLADKLIAQIEINRTRKESK